MPAWLLALLGKVGPISSSLMSLLTIIEGIFAHATRAGMHAALADVAAHAHEVADAIVSNTEHAHTMPLAGQALNPQSQQPGQSPHPAP